MINGQISKILKSKGITPQQINQQALQNQEKQLYMLDKKSEIIIQTFKSVAEASQYCIDKKLSKDNIKGISAHISQCCNGIRKTAYQHKWSYI